MRVCWSVAFSFFPSPLLSLSLALLIAVPLPSPPHLSFASLSRLSFLAAAVPRKEKPGLCVALPSPPRPFSSVHLLVYTHNTHQRRRPNRPPADPIHPSDMTNDEQQAAAAASQLPANSARGLVVGLVRGGVDVALVGQELHGLPVVVIVVVVVVVWDVSPCLDNPKHAQTSHVVIQFEHTRLSK